MILDYLAETLGRFGWRDDDERREILRWLLFDNHKLTSYTATYRFLRALAKDPNPDVRGGVPQARGGCLERPGRASGGPRLSWSASA